MQKTAAIDQLFALNVSRETIERLEIYAAELEKWNPKINLVAPSTLPELWTRHFVDSLQILPLSPPNFEKWLDIGSGGGFPALVLAAHFVQKPFVLVESDARKSAFLRKTAREMGLDHVRIETARIEALPPQNADVISARACAPLDQLLSWATPHASANTVFLFPKGKNWQNELTLAAENWQIDYQMHLSMTDSDARILEIKEIQHNG